MDDSLDERLTHRRAGPVGIKPQRIMQECPMIKVFRYLKRKPGRSPQRFAD
jgi:hypothetical protein